MATQLFVNFPTDDLPAAKQFYADLGWTINPQFSDENAICVVISEENYVMVLRRPFYDGFLAGTGKTSGSCTRGNLMTSTATTGNRSTWTQQRSTK